MLEYRAGCTSISQTVRVHVGEIENRHARPYELFRLHGDR